MGSLRILSISSVALLAATTFTTTMTTTDVLAADPPPVRPPIVNLPPEVVPRGFGGWYLRGDIGYAKTSVAGVRYFQGGDFTGSFEQYDIDESWMFGGGIGYQINDWFRVDLTANMYSEADFTGSSEFNTPCFNGPPTAVCSYSDNATFRATTLLANAYVDMGTWQGITPYVGAGIGGALVHWGDLSNVEYAVSGPAPIGPLLDSVHEGRSGWRFAYALHAGASYDLTANLKVDAGYSYTNIGGGNMFGFPVGSGSSGTQGISGDIKIHTFKVGLRYAFN